MRTIVKLQVETVVAILLDYSGNINDYGSDSFGDVVEEIAAAALIATTVPTLSTAATL